MAYEYRNERVEEVSNDFVSHENEADGLAIESLQRMAQDMARVAQGGGLLTKVNSVNVRFTSQGALVTARMTARKYLSLR